MNAALVFGLALAVGALGEKDAPKKDAPTIVGEWNGEKAVRGGNELPIPDGGIKVTFTADGKMLFKEGNKDEETGSYKVDAKKNPGEIDISPPKEGGEMKGIFKLDGDTLTICLADKDATERPTKFESTDGSKIMLVTLKRIKK